MATCWLGMVYWIKTKKGEVKNRKFDWKGVIVGVGPVQTYIMDKKLKKKDLEVDYVRKPSAQN